MAWQFDTANLFYNLYIDCTVEYEYVCSIESAAFHPDLCETLPTQKVGLVGLLYRISGTLARARLYSFVCCVCDWHIDILACTDLMYLKNDLVVENHKRLYLKTDYLQLTCT